MKRLNLAVPTTIALSALLTAAARAGDLNPPPGAIQPTDRVALNAQIITLPHTITQPGSYVLTSNLTGVASQHGIIIDADNVTLDLNGFALIGATGSHNAIYCDSHSNIRITNGAVRKWGGNGIEITYATNSSCIIDHIRADENAGVGIRSNDGAISHCTANTNANGGIQLDVGSISHCAARDNGLFGLYLYNGSIDASSATDNDSWGIFLASGSAANCSATYNTGYGFYLGASPNNRGGATVTGCTAANNAVDGFRVEDNCTVTNNNAHDNGGTGIRVYGTHSRIDSNTLVANTSFGIQVGGTSNIVIRNTISGNGGGFSFAAGNATGQIINATGTLGFVATDPWANLEY